MRTRREFASKLSNSNSVRTGEASKLHIDLKYENHHKKAGSDTWASKQALKYVSGFPNSCSHRELIKKEAASILQIKNSKQLYEYVKNRKRNKLRNELLCAHHKKLIKNLLCNPQRGKPNSDHVKQNYLHRNIKKRCFPCTTNKWVYASEIQ
jgi:hypothetical protein